MEHCKHRVSVTARSKKLSSALSEAAEPKSSHPRSHGLRGNEGGENALRLYTKRRELREEPF